MTSPLRMFPRGDRGPKAEDLLDDPATRSVRTAAACARRAPCCRRIAAT